RDGFKADLCRRQFGIADFCLETKYRRRIALRTLACYISTKKLDIGVRDTARRHTVGVGKVLPDHHAQFDFIAVTEKTRQGQIDQERLRYFHRLRGVAAELIRFRLADCRYAVRG